MKLACIFIPHFFFYIEALRRVDIRSEPTVIIKTLGSRQNVVDCSLSVDGAICRVQNAGKNVFCACLM